MGTHRTIDRLRVLGAALLVIGIGALGLSVAGARAADAAAIPPTTTTDQEPTQNNMVCPGNWLKFTAFNSGSPATQVGGDVKLWFTIANDALRIDAFTTAANVPMVFDDVVIFTGGSEGWVFDLQDRLSTVPDFLTPPAGSGNITGVFLCAEAVNPQVDVAKTITNPAPTFSEGETIEYSIVVTNAGNVTLTNVELADDAADIVGCNPQDIHLNPGTLAPGAVVTCTAQHVVNDADVTDGSFVNTATATAEFDWTFSVFDFLQEVTDSDSAVAGLSTELHIFKILESFPGDSSTFTITVACPGFTEAVVLGGAQDAFVFAPADQDCTVTEQPNAAFSTTVLVDGPGVPLASNVANVHTAADHTIEFTNTRESSALVVDKTSGQFDATFNFTLDCSVDAFDQPFSITTVAGTGSESFPALPAGMTCTVLETVPTGWTQTSVNPPNGTVQIPADGTAQVTFGNSRQLGRIVVSKTTVTPAGVAGHFEFAVNCDGTAYDETLVLDTLGPVVGATVATNPTDHIPTGTVCTVTETAPAGWTLSSQNPVDGQVSVGLGDNVVLFTNSRNLGGLLVTKTVTGTTAIGPLDGTFDFELACDGTAFDKLFSITTSMGSGSELFTGIPAGTSCSVEELGVPVGWTAGAITDTDGGADGVVVVGGEPDDANDVVGFSNSRDVTSFTIDKTIDISTGGTSFEFTVACTADGVGPVTLQGPFTIPLADGVLTGSVVVDDVPTGATCTIDEAPHADYTQSTPAAGADGVWPDNGPDATPNVVEFVNARETATISVFKIAVGGNGVFDFAIDCPGTTFDHQVQITTIIGLGLELSDPIPVGLGCSVTELAEPGWTQLLPLQNGSVPVTVQAGLNPALFINATLAVETVKTVVGAPMGGFELGETVTFEIVVTNTGVGSLAGVTVVENTPGVSLGSCTRDGNPVTLPLGTLFASDDTLVCSATHVVTQADMDAGSFENVATATGADPFDPDDTVSDPDNAIADMNQLPGIAIDKVETSTGPYGLGDVITFDIVVENTGNVTLTDLSVTESLGATLIGCTPTAPATLAPGATMTCAAAHIVDLDDTNAGEYTNTATADSGQTDPVQDGITLPIVQAPELTIDKVIAASPAPPVGGYTVGSTIHYEIYVSNTGTITLTGVEITDAGVGAILGDCTPEEPPGGFTLDPGDVVVCDATHVVTQADMDSGAYSNTATASSEQTSAIQDTVTATLPYNPSLRVEKVARPLPAGAGVGTVITYDITVTNNGTVTLTNVTVADLVPTATLGVCNPATPVASLAPGASITCTATHALTQADLDLGTYSNVARADSDQTPPVDDPELVLTPDPVVDLAIVKRVLTTFAVGQQASYQLDVRNNGPGFEPRPRISDTLPTGLTFVSAQGPGWTCSLDGRTVVCRSADGVAVGQNLPAIVVTVLVSADAPATISNTAIVSGVRPDRVLGNNESTATASVTVVLGQVVETPPAVAAQTSFAATGAASLALATTGIGAILAGLVLLVVSRRRPAREA